MTLPDKVFLRQEALDDGGLVQTGKPCQVGFHTQMAADRLAHADELLRAKST